MKPNLETQLETNEKNFPGGFKNDGDVCFVHFSKEEAMVYDELQGGAKIADEEGMLPLRSYNPLGELLKHPDFVQLVEAVVLHRNEDGVPNQPDLHQAYETGEKMLGQMDKKWTPAPGDEIPEIRELAKKGRKPDSIMVYMPSNVIFMLGKFNNGIVHINPSTGFPAFGFFNKMFKEVGRVFHSNPVREVIRAGATIAGAVLGGPLGAMAGSAAGSAVTGRRPQDWLGQAAKAGALTYGAQLAAPYIPGFGSAGSYLAGSGIPGGAALGGTMNAWANPAASEAASGPAWGTMTSHTSSTGENLMGGAQRAAQAAPAAEAAKAAPGGLASLMDNPLVKAAPYALSIGSGFMAKNAEKQRYELERREREQHMREERAREEEALQRAGFYTPLQHSEHDETIVNPKYGEPGEPYFIYKGDSRFDQLAGLKRASGGEVVSHNKIPLKDKVLIKGPGKGQSDVIHTRAPEGSYIVDASTISMLGDGSTDAGAEVLKDFIHDVMSETHPQINRMYKNGNYEKVPVALSRDEGYVDPHVVLAIGRGHHSKGVEKLDSFVANIRKHKASNGKKLPPKAKSIKTYMGG